MDHDVQIRWMLRSDMPEVLEIESESFEFAWDEQDFRRCIGQRNCIAMVAECDHRVAGFMVYELHKTLLHILNFAVAPAFRRQGIGRRMLAKLVRKLHPLHRTRILLEIRETNLPAQLFFRDAGFRAIKILRAFYEDTSDDAYVMAYVIGLPLEHEQDGAASHRAKG